MSATNHLDQEAHCGGFARGVEGSVRMDYILFGQMGRTRFVGIVDVDDINTHVSFFG